MVRSSGHPKRTSREEREESEDMSCDGYEGQKSGLKRKDWKSSFERFGDDLTEVIVSYLTTEEKFRFECLSKQWQRLVFNKHFRLKISANDKRFCERLKLKSKAFERCLKKL